MGISITGGHGCDDFFDDIKSQAIDDAERELARGLAESARAEGLATVNSIGLDINSDSPEFELSEQRIRSLANDELARGLD